jgi:hypothetical protein
MTPTIIDIGIVAAIAVFELLCIGAFVVVILLVAP